MNFDLLKYSRVMLFILLIGCSSDGHDCETDPVRLPNALGPIDGAEYTESLSSCRLPRVQSYTASNIVGAEISAEQGTVLLVNPQSFADQNGEFIDGDVTISIIEMYQPGEIIACQLSTNGINESGFVEPLFSESMFYLDITFNGQPVVFLQPIQVFVPSQNLGIEQFVFRSPTCPELECTVLWERVLATEPVFEEPYVDATGVKTFGYRTFIDALGWQNIGHYNGDNRARTTLYNKTKAGYNKTNANVFVQYDTPSTAIGLFDVYDADLDVFTENYTQIPIDQAVAVIFVTVQNQDFLFATKQGIVESEFLTATLDIITVTEQGFINALNNL